LIAGTPNQAEMAKIKLSGLNRSSLSEQVREEVLRRILDGQLKPGERIVETRLAQEMGTSQAPIREALRSLEALGVLHAVPNRGVHVRVLQPSELAEIYLIRAELESYAASLAVVTLKSDVTELEAHIAAMNRAAAAHSLSQFAEANAQFHRHIVVASGLAILVEIWAMLDVKARTMVTVTRNGRDLAAIADSHKPIVEAIKSGQPMAARRAMRQHILAYKPKA
jgi:DNA-binding GntR family transcriptional regulator